MAWLLTWLVHGLAIALVTRFALRVLPGLSAATRYAVWWAALVLVLILPIIRGIAIEAGASSPERASARVSEVGSGLASSATSASSAPSASSLASPATGASSAAASDVAAASGASGAAGVWADAARSAAYASMRPAVAVPPVSLPRVPDWFLSILIGLWLGCVMVGFAQLAYSVQAVRRLKASCRRLLTPLEADLPMWSAVKDRGRAVRVRASDHVRTAAVLGLTRPVIAVPRDAAEALTPHEIDQVVLHEYAHVQRYDDWTKLLQVLIGAFAGWHPAVRLMMREIDFEREAACDDYVVDVTGAPRAYARCLTKVIEMMPGSSFDLAAVPHAYSSASHATTRIERLLDRKRPAGRLAVMPVMAGSATLAVLAFCTVHALPIATDLPRVHESGAGAHGAMLASAAAGHDGGLGGDLRGDRATAGRGANIVAAGKAADVNGANINGAGRGESTTSAAAPLGLNLRIAAASTLPFELPFSRLSPLSRTQIAAPRVTQTTAPAAAVPVRDEDSHALTSSTRGFASAASPSTALARADKPADVNRAPVPPNAPNAPGAAGAASVTATPFTSAPTLEARHARETPAPAGHGSGNAARRAARKDAPGDSRGTAPSPARVETTFALGPVVVAAGDSDAMAAASDAGPVERAWENTRDATSKAMGVSARAVGSATKTAGDATKTATNKAAAGVKAGGTHTARALGRAKRAIASVF